MRAEYDEYFEDQLRGLPGPFFYPDGRFFEPPLRELFPKDWRSDARYFLAVVVETMVVRPYLAVEGFREAPTLSSARLWRLLQEDVDRIVRLAEEIAKGRGRDYVSATSVTMALGVLAPELATTSLQIWGPRESEPPPP